MFLPDDKLHAVIAPVCKKDPKKHNVSQATKDLSPLKIKEHKLKLNIMTYFDAHSLLNPNQHGYRCEKQLIKFIQEFPYSIEQGHQSDIIELMDLS